MKNVYYLVIGMFLSASAFGQSVRTQTKTMSLGPQTAYYIEIDGADKDIVEDAWKEYVKEAGKTKENKKAKEWVTDNGKITMINGISDVDLYFNIEEGKGQTTSYLWVDLGGRFATPMDTKAESKGIEQFMSDFYVVVRKKVIQKELDREEKKIKDLNKDLLKLGEKNEDLHKDIENYKKKITEAQKNIEKNLNDQDTKMVEIGAQKKVVDKVIDRLNSVGKN